MSSSHGTLENLILNAIWSVENIKENPISVGEVQEIINNLNVDKTWAYTTVKTVLDRLAEKCLIDRIKCGKKFLYTSVIAREELGRQAIKRIAMQFYNDNMTDLMKAAENICEEEKLLIYEYSR